MRILIIDDDSEGVEYIATFLQLEGVTVDSTTSGAEGLKLLDLFAPDLVILDILLPDVDGHELCSQIRSLSDVPILMLSAFATDIRDQIVGLEYGADDYLIKPVDFDLLRARITAILRRTAQLHLSRYRQNYSDGYLTVDFSTQQVRIHDKQVSLSYLEYQLLELLICNAGQVVPMLEIIEELWGTTSTGKDCRDYVHTYIRRLRNKIEPDPSAPCYLVTEYGFGYRFVPHP